MIMRIITGFLSLFYPHVASGKTLCDSEVKTKVCWAMCRRDGYDTGEFVADACLCGVKKPWEEFTGVTLKVTRLPDGTKIKSYEWND